MQHAHTHTHTQLFTWLAEKLPTAGRLPLEFSAIVPHLFSCLEDRSSDVRKKAQVALPLVMAKVGYDTMLKHTDKLKVQHTMTSTLKFYLVLYEWVSQDMCKCVLPENQDNSEMFKRNGSSLNLWNVLM